MARQFDMCDVCKLDTANICNYECIKRREDFAFRFFTCANFIYDDGKPITNAELLSTNLKTDLETTAIQLWYMLAMDYGFDTKEEFIEWLKAEAKILHRMLNNE